MRIQEISSKAVWEKFIAKHSPRSLFQSWNWGEVENNVKCLWRIGIYTNTKLIGIAQILKVAAKRGSFFHIRHGPIFSKWERESFQFLLDYLKNKTKEEKVSFIRISPLIENTTVNKSFLSRFGFFDAPIHAMDGEYCWVLDLDKSEEELLAQTRKSTRYLIKQAQKMGIDIVKSKSKEDIGDFLDLYHQTAKRQKFVEHQGITEEFRQFIKDDQILLFKGYYQKKLQAASLILFYNHQAIYHHSASFPTKVPVNYLLQWEAIKEAKKRNKTVYNFWGVAPEDNRRHPWGGLSMFKKGFGGRVVAYLHAKDLPQSSSYWLTYLVEWVRKVWKGY